MPDHLDQIAQIKQIDRKRKKTFDQSGKMLYQSGKRLRLISVTCCTNGGKNSLKLLNIGNFD